MSSLEAHVEAGYPSLESAHLAEVIELARRAAGNPAVPVLIVSEPGCGAEELARLIHDATPRPPPPLRSRLVSVQCRDAAQATIARELFGKTDGRAADSASPLERARPGTLFIDEVFQLPVAAQARLFAFIVEEQERAAEKIPAACVRVVAATAVSLERAVRDRTFRRDLHERLSPVTLHIPPLRERPQDILPLARKLLRACAKAARKDIHDLTPAAASKLEQHLYPGNIGELGSIIQRAVILETGAALDAGSIWFDERSPAGARTFLSVMVSSFSRDRGRLPRVDEIERAYIIWLLEQTGGNRTAVARIVGVSYPTIMKKITDYDIDFRSAILVARAGAPDRSKSG
jgi:DNA-binding NtrC family response regulator